MHVNKCNANMHVNICNVSTDVNKCNVNTDVNILQDKILYVQMEIYKASHYLF